MTDIVERLRHLSQHYAGAGIFPLCNEAADEIERVNALFDKWHTIAAEKQAEIERLMARTADELLLEENKLMRAALLSQSDEIERLRGREQVGMIDAASNS